MNRLLCLCDSPTAETGYARVAQNLLSRWQAFFDGGISVFGINYSGWPHSLPYHIMPAGYHDWNTDKKLGLFLKQIQRGQEAGKPYTHIWLMHDIHQLARHGFPRALKRGCDHFGIVSALYFPVDAELEPSWLDVLDSVDLPVAYTDYARSRVEVISKSLASRAEVLPHGVDHKIYHPLPAGDRAQIRSRVIPDWPLKEKDLVLLNVNSHQRRKGLVQSFQILKELLQLGIRAKLIMHMPRFDKAEQTSLDMMANQIGVPGWSWRCTGDWAFNELQHALGTQGFLNKLYNAADIVLSTTKGEGWGLSINEGLASGAVVAAPMNTACAEILTLISGLMPNRTIKLPMSNVATVDMMDASRVRYPVDPVGSARAIAHYLSVNGHPDRQPLSPAARNWLDWDRIAAQWLKLMDRKKPAISQAYSVESQKRKLISYEECIAPMKSFREQTEFASGYIDLPVTRELIHFNPSLVRGPDNKLWLLARQQDRDSKWSSRIVRVELGADMKVVGKPVPIAYVGMSQGQMEDPRVVWRESARHYVVSYAYWNRPDPKHSEPTIQQFACFDEEWKRTEGPHCVPYGRNGHSWEKNWLPFIYNERLLFAYSFSPHVVIMPHGQGLSEWRTQHALDWAWGEIRGGTPPVLVGDEYVSFFHSSTPWKDPYRRYHMGAYAFSAKEPFRVTRMTEKPILSGSDQDSRVHGDNKPVVIFPGGAVLENNGWTVVFGVNDEACGWIRIPHDKLEMKSC